MQEKERRLLLSYLNPEQVRFLENNIKQSKCSIWIEKLAKLKGITITNDMDKQTILKKIDSWVLIDVLDGGFQRRPYKCLCGRSLRYQYILKNANKDVTVKLGQECLKKYTNLDKELVTDIINQFHKVNIELDDILIRYEEGIIDKQLAFIDDPAVPDQYKKQLALGLPLSKKQEQNANNLIEQRIAIQEKQKEEEEIERVERSLTQKQRDFINRFISKEDKHQLIIKLKNGDYIYTLKDIEGLEISDIVEQKIKLCLPLNNEETKDIEFQKLFLRDKDKESDILSSMYMTTCSSSQDDNQSFYPRKTYITKATHLTLNYATIMKNHSDLLDEMNVKQKYIPKVLLKDWKKIKSLIENAKAGKEIGRRTFLLKLSNLSNAMGIYADVYRFYR